MIIKYKEILQILKANPNFERLLMFDRVFRGDDNFFVASTDWYEREFFTWFKIQPKHYRVWDYEASWDCDKFAGAFNPKRSNRGWSEIKRMKDLLQVNK